MTGGAAPALIADPETRRALRLDALAAILPVGPPDRLAELLTDPDVEATTSPISDHIPSAGVWIRLK
jgi:hypothetical protein